MNAKVKVAPTIGVQRLNINDISDRSTMLVIAKRGGGKSVFLKDLLYHKRYLSTGIIASGTENANKYFSSFVPDSFIHNDYNPELVSKTITRQERKLEEKRKRTGKEKVEIDPVFIVMDDLNYNAKEWRNDTTMKYLVSNGRHAFMFLVITSQNLKNITPEIRGNSDYVVIFSQNSKANQKKLFDEFGGCFESFESFTSILTACTKDFGCLVIKCTGKGFSDQVFWYKAEVIDTEFRVGHPIFWNYHKKKYDKNYKKKVLQKMEQDSTKKNKINVSLKK